MAIKYTFLMYLVLQLFPGIGKSFAMKCFSGSILAAAVLAVNQAYIFEV